MLSASHRLHTLALSDDENRTAYGKCNNRFGHGHNYTVEVLIGGPVDEQTGMVINLADLDEVVQRKVLDRFDHVNLNLDPLFEDLVPTTENLCKAVFQILKGALPAMELVHVRVEETENNFFQCLGTEDFEAVNRQSA